jgi:signal transduction histidine kinase
VRISRPRPVDVLLPAVVAVAGTVETVTVGYQPRLLTCATFLLGAVVLAFARSAPIAVPLLVTAIYAAAPLLGIDVSQPAAWVPFLASAYFSTGLYAARTRRLAGLAGVLVALGMAMAGLVWFTDFQPNLLFGLIMTVGPWALGTGLRRTLDESHGAGARAERERLRRALAGPRAARSERERIAVELPDVLAHSLGAMLVQSSAAGDLIRRDPRAAARALHAVADSGREALAETGRMLRLLRDDSADLRLSPKPVVAGDGAPYSGKGGPGGRLPVTDLLLPAFIGAVGTAEIGFSGDRHLSASLGALWLAVVLLCARRAFPLSIPIAVIGVMVAAPLVAVNTEDPASWILVIAVACFSAGRYVPRSRVLSGLASVLAAIGLLIVVAAARGEFSADVVFLLPFAAGPWAVGYALRRTLERTRSLAAEAERARLEQDLEAERAAGAERKRIARELHDLLANSLTIMVIHASLAADLVVKGPDAAAAAVIEVERSGRTALAETGRLLHLINDDRDSGTTHPQRGLTDIPTLTAEYTHAGLAIAMEIDTAERLPAGVNVSIYHIVQEALTNVLKHAPGSPVLVRLARTASEVAVEVRNGPTSSGPIAAVRSGHGLTGLRERVSVFGGSLEARPTTDGGFLLTATLPVEEAR